jgi:hypothetical protein
LRCLGLLLGLLGIALAPLPLAAQNQQSQEGVREFPHRALRGVLQVTAPPDVLLDGKADRLSPGVRIRSPQNMLVVSGALAGQALVVNFTREQSGLIHEVWLLTPDEAAQKVKLATPERNFIFESEIDTSRRDDGKTPFNQLPVFPNR